ncbi:MAG: VOC family protein [Moraxellaceae bacterium]|nr:MAG: VOC family protein [Moraxellaceae bacterium]
MTYQNSSIVSHVSIGTNQFDEACAFYGAVLGALDIGIVMQHPGAVAFGRDAPEFWVQIPHDNHPATVGNCCHVGFIADNKQQVHAFYDAAIAAGAICDGSPGPRPIYGEQYYGCYVRDLDGNKIEATFWDEN